MPSEVLEEIDIIIEETVNEALSLQREELNGQWQRYTGDVVYKMQSKRNFWFCFSLFECAAIVSSIGVLLFVK